MKNLINLILITLSSCSSTVPQPATFITLIVFITIAVLLYIDIKLSK